MPTNPKLDANQTIRKAFVTEQEAHRVIPLTNGDEISSTNPLIVSNLPFAWDYVSMALSVGNTRETYTFKTGGSGGTTVGNVEINYTTSTRDVLTNATITAV